MSAATLPAATAAAPATGGMSLLLPLLTSFGPAILSKLFGGGKTDDQQRQEQLRQILMRMLSPQAIAALTQQFYQQALQSPAYSQAQGTIATGANQTANQVAERLGASGITGSGTGAILNSLTPSLVGSQLAGLRTAAYQGAQSQAQNNLQSQIAALQNTQQSGPSRTQSLVGTGIEAFTPYLTAYIKSKYPQFASIGVPQAAK